MSKPDRFDEEVFALGDVSGPNVRDKVAAWGRKLYAEGQASKTAEVEALKEKVGRMEKALDKISNGGCGCGVGTHCHCTESEGDLRLWREWARELAQEALTPPASEKSQVRINAEEDPDYCPYCLRCSATVRMKKVEPFYWRCACGAEHDERTTPPASPKSEEKKCTCGEDSPDSLVVHRKDGPCYLRERLAGPGWVHLSLGYPWREPDRCGEVLKMDQGEVTMLEKIG